jgi:hypothetical protein
MPYIFAIKFFQPLLPGFMFYYALSGFNSIFNAVINAESLMV